MGCHALLQGILSTQGSNPRLLHWQVDSSPLRHLGSPRSPSTGTCRLMSRGTVHPEAKARGRIPEWCLPLVYHQCPRGRVSSQKWAVSMFPGELQLPPSSRGDAPRSAGRSVPGSFQINACALEHEFVCAPFKSEVSISSCPLGLPKVSPTDLQSQMFWRLTFLAQDPSVWGR